MLTLEPHIEAQTIADPQSLQSVVQQRSPVADVRHRSHNKRTGINSVAGSAQDHMAVPTTIKIARVEDYHTDTIGRCKDGRQFMAFVVASLPWEKLRAPEGWKKHKQWHAVLHTFDPTGKHLNTEVWTAGTSADGEREAIERASARLSEMLAALEPVQYGDVMVSLFCVEVEGREFGLVDASEPEECYERIDLLPNDLAFFEPWDGIYDT